MEGLRPFRSPLTAPRSHLWDWLGQKWQEMSCKVVCRAGSNCMQVSLHMQDFPIGCEDGYQLSRQRTWAGIEIDWATGTAGWAWSFVLPKPMLRWSLSSLPPSVRSTWPFRKPKYCRKVGRMGKVWAQCRSHPRPWDHSRYKIIR